MTFDSVDDALWPGSSEADDGDLYSIRSAVDSALDDADSDRVTDPRITDASLGRPTAPFFVQNVSSRGG